MESLDEIFAALARSTFRSRFHLSQEELSYLNVKGMATILVHARRFICERLAPAEPLNDGKQTPMRNHPVFIAQHATATCCRGCLAQWHGMAKGKSLSEDEIEYVVSVIARWLTPYVRLKAEKTRDGCRCS